jgi:phosphopantetheinyl transferase
MRLWTAKEALAKRHGAGLRLMSGPDADLDVEAETIAGRLTFASPVGGYACALASSEAIRDVRIVGPQEVAWVT